MYKTNRFIQMEAGKFKSWLVLVPTSWSLPLMEDRDSIVDEDAAIMMVVAVGIDCRCKSIATRQSARFDGSQDSKGPLAVESVRSWSWILRCLYSIMAQIGRGSVIKSVVSSLHEKEIK